MKALIALSAAALLTGVPFAASADDDDHRRGWHHRGPHWGGYDHRPYGHYKPGKHHHHHHYYAPPRAAYYPPVPRGYGRPVYVPPPAPVVVYPRPYVYPPTVSIGFGFQF